MNLRNLFFGIGLMISSLMYSQDDYKLVSIYKNTESTVFLNIKGYNLETGNYQLPDSIYVSFRNGSISKSFNIDGDRVSGSWAIERPAPKTVVIYFDCERKVF